MFGVNTFHDWLMIALYLLIPPFVCFSVHDAILTDDILKHHYFQAIYLCVCFLVFACLIILSQVCKLRRKPKEVSKPLSRLYDSDLESEDDTEVPQGKEVNPLFSMVENFFLFCSYRHVYAVVAVVGALLFIPFLISFAAWYMFGTFSLEDLGTSLTILIISAIFLENLLLILSNVPEMYTWEPPETSYRPFEEFVRVPVKVFASKVLAIYVYNIFSIASSIFYLLCAIYGLMVVCNMPEEEVARFNKASDEIEVYELVRIMMIIATVCGVSMVVDDFWTPCKLAKEGLLMTIEKNWQRNLNAFDFLLHDKELSTLEELREALSEKSKQENLTREEVKALQYIARPLWKSKRVFLDKSMGIARRPRINLLDPPKKRPENPSAGPSEDKPSGPSEDKPSGPSEDKPSGPSEDKPSTSDNQPSTPGDIRHLRSRKIQL